MEKNRKEKGMKKIDNEIMQKLLNEPGVKENVEKMTPDELKFYKKLLVDQGIYAKYVREQKQKLFEENKKKLQEQKSDLSNSFHNLKSVFKRGE